MIIPNLWDNKKWQPNHQPVKIFRPQKEYLLAGWRNDRCRTNSNKWKTMENIQHLHDSNTCWCSINGVPPNHPFLGGIFPYKPTILDSPMTMETPFGWSFTRRIDHDDYPLTITPPELPPNHYNRHWLYVIWPLTNDNILTYDPSLTIN